MADWTSAPPAQMTDAWYGKFSSYANSWCNILEMIC
jgi:hypothetical protein